MKLLTTLKNLIKIKENKQDNELLELIIALINEDSTTIYYNNHCLIKGEHVSILIRNSEVTFNDGLFVTCKNDFSIDVLKKIDSEVQKRIRTEIQKEVESLNNLNFTNITNKLNEK